MKNVEIRKRLPFYAAIQDGFNLKPTTAVAAQNWLEQLPVRW